MVLVKEVARWDLRLTKKKRETERKKDKKKKKVRSLNEWNLSKLGR